VTYYYRIGDPIGTGPGSSFGRFWWSTGVGTTMVSTAVIYDGRLAHYVGNNWTIYADKTINQDEWYKFEYTYDLADQVQWVVTRCADDSVALDMTYATEVVNQDTMYALQFQVSTYETGSGHHILLDNVGLIPEPASLTLLGMGCLAVLIRRRRA